MVFGWKVERYLCSHVKITKHSMTLTNQVYTVVNLRLPAVIDQSAVTIEIGEHRYVETYKSKQTFHVA